MSRGAFFVGPNAERYAREYAEWVDAHGADPTRWDMVETRLIDAAYTQRTAGAYELATLMLEAAVLIRELRAARAR